MRSFVIHEVFRAVAAEHADGVAIRLGGEAISYRELDHRSDAVAAAIQRQNIPPGATVAIVVARSIDTFVSMLGILKAGCAYVPIDRDYPEAVVKDYVARCRASAIIVAGGEARGDAVDGVIRLSPGEVEREGTPPAARDVGPDALAYVMYTSGTTGEPKGVAVPHRGVVRLVRDTNYVSIRETDVVLQMSPLTFDASTFEIWGALLNGATLLIYGEGGFDPNVLRESIRDNAVTILWLTAGLFHLIARHSVESLAGLRVLLAGGDVIQPDAVRRVFERYPSITFVNGYGPTENTTFTCCHVMDASSPIGDSIPIGRAITGTTVHIWDARQRPVARGEVGELYTGGSGVALCYLNAPDATGAAFWPDPERPGATVYRTGDLVRELPDGTIDFLGRADNLVKVRGYRVSTTELQRTIRGIDGIEDVVVAAEDDGTGNKRLVAYVQSGEEPKKVRNLIKGNLEKSLPKYMIPTAIHVRPSFPLNRNGKVDARSLLSMSMSSEG